jgi:hypothetical protein
MAELVRELEHEAIRGLGRESEGSLGPLAPRLRFLQGCLGLVALRLRLASTCFRPTREHEGYEGYENGAPYQKSTLDANARLILVTL